MLIIAAIYQAIRWIENSSKSCRRGSRFQSWSGHKITSRVSEIPSAPLASDITVHYISPATRTIAFIAIHYHHPIMGRYVISNTESVSNSTTNQPKHVAVTTEDVQLVLSKDQLSELHHSFRIRASFRQKDGARGASWTAGGLRERWEQQSEDT
jgi:hypothetical protein